MKSVIISGGSKDIQLLESIAEKMGMSVKQLSQEELENIDIEKAIPEGKTGEFVDTDKFLTQIKNNTH
jgi:hypothetical protein